MNTALADDALALVLICSYVAIKPGEEPVPLSLSEWNLLSSKIQVSRFKTPGGLLGVTADALELELQVPADEASRLSALLERGSAAGFALESLSGAGIRIVTRVDSEYPQRLKEKLKAHSPVVLFYSGKMDLTSQHGVAIVGSRDVDPAGEEFASELAKHCAKSKWNVVSGGAKGVDIVAMKSAIESGGTCIGILSDSLAKKIREQQTREAIFEERLLLMSPFHPNAGFQIANAMSRNKCIYALADYAVVVASDLEKGGTWAGATENLRKDYVPLLVRTGESVSEGNRALLAKGAASLEITELRAGDRTIPQLLADKVRTKGETPLQPQQLRLN